MATTERIFNGNGTAGPFTYNFPALEAEDVRVSIDGIDSDAYTVDFTLSTITFTTAPYPTASQLIRIYRFTDIDTISAEFSAGSAIRAQDLNNNFIQNLYITQETRRDVSDAVAGQIPDGSIGTSKLADGAINTVKVTSIDSEKIRFTQTGTGALQRTVESKLQDVVSVKDFIPSGTNTATTDCTSYFQAAIAAVETGGTISVPTGNYLIGSTINLNKYCIIEGNNSVLIQNTAYVGKLFNELIPGDSLQTISKLVLKDLRIVRDTIDSFNSDPDLGSIGIYLQGANVILDNVRTEKFNVGVYINSGQFGTAYNLKHISCNVGLCIKTKVGAGGGNSWTFYDHQAIVCNVLGVYIKNNSIFPNHSIYFRNPSYLANIGATFAVFGSNVYMDGGAPEANWTSAASSLSFDGNTIPKCSIYGSGLGTNITISNFFNAESSLTPFIVLANSATLETTSVEGFGNSGTYIQQDGTCNVIADNLNQTQGRFTGLVNTPTIRNAAGFGIALNGVSDFVINDYTLTNNASNPIVGDVGFSQVVVNSTWDSDYGLVSAGTFGTTAGNQDSNRISVANTTTVSNGVTVIGISLYSNIAATLQFGCYNTSAKFNVEVPANKWIRTYIITELDTNSSSNPFWYVTPAVAYNPAPSIKLGRVMYYTEVDKSWKAYSAVNAVIRGAYNSGFEPSHYGRLATSVPTTGTWVKGDIVWNSDPDATEYIGWVCTVAGTPGTWKGFGVIQT